MSSPVLQDATQRQPGKGKSVIWPRFLALSSSTALSNDSGTVPYGSRSFAGTAIVQSVDDKTSQFIEGDEVLFLIEPFDLTHLNPENGTPQYLIVDNTMMMKKPRDFSLVAAASLLGSFASAVAAICIALNLSPGQMLDGNDQDADCQALLLVGGATPVGSAVAQVLRVARPNVFFLTTVGSLEEEYDEEGLIAKSTEQILLGGQYVIEHQAEDLVGHLRATLEAEGKSGVECIIDAMWQCGGREDELKGLLNTPYGRVVKARDEEHAAALLSKAGSEIFTHATQASSEVSGGHHVMAILDKMLREGDYKLPSYVRIGERRWSDFRDADQRRVGLEDSLVLSLI